MLGSSLFVVFSIALRIADSIPIHKHMTRDEIRATFQNGHGRVPNYELVSVFHTFHEHDPQNQNNTRIAVKVKAFGRKISLYLEPNDGILADLSTPVWTVSTHGWNPEYVRYKRVPNPFAKIGIAYHDLSKGSAVVAYRGVDGEHLILGNLNSDLVVRPLPHRLHNIISRQAKHLNDSSPNFLDVDTNLRQTHYHVVFKRNEPDIKPPFKTVKREGRNNNRYANKRSKRSIPEVVYPEILVTVDYSLYAVLNAGLEEATRYVVALWNAIDLRYRLLSEPAIRVHIAGIIISLSNRATPYLDNNRRGTTELDSDLALTAMSHYFYAESARFDFSTYDMAIALTSLDMSNRVFNDVFDTSTLGYAYEWGACNRSHVDKNTEAVGIVEDNGGFKAIVAAAHEIAHLMGVSHDGLEEAVDCPGYHGFIMSATYHAGENSFLWSECSLKNLYEFFSSEQATCLFNKPRPGVALRRVLPGKLLTLDQQCEQISGTRACNHDHTVCARLECYIPGSGSCQAKISAAEGSYCGPGYHCINGHCLSEKEQFVPYTLSTTTKPFAPGFLDDDLPLLHRRKFNVTRN